jgi:hypothetical protein
MRHASLLVILGALVCGGCSQETLTGIEPEAGVMTFEESTGLNKTTLKMLPFEGNVSGYGWFNVDRTDCPTGSLPLDAEGHGNASHLGKFKIFYEHCSYAQIDPTNPTYVGTATITAANGDQLLVTYNGVATSPVTYLEYSTFTGGTGRFENVSGTFEHTGSFGYHPAGYAFNDTFEGDISSVGSSK